MIYDSVPWGGGKCQVTTHKATASISLEMSENSYDATENLRGHKLPRGANSRCALGLIPVGASRFFSESQTFNTIESPLGRKHPSKPTFGLTPRALETSSRHPRFRQHELVTLNEPQGLYLELFYLQRPRHDNRFSPFWFPFITTFFRSHHYVHRLRRTQHVRFKRRDRSIILATNRVSSGRAGGRTDACFIRK